MKNLLENNNLMKPPRIGEIVKGKVIGKEKGALFLDLGAIGAGIIFGKEFYDAKDILRGLKIGDLVFAKVTDLEDENGYIELSINQAGKELTWEELTLKKESKELITVKILGANKGGLLAELSGTPAFLPVSQLSSANYPKVEGGDALKILKELQKFVGKEMAVQIFDLDQKTEKLILSEKLKEADKIRDFLKNYKVADVVDGEITGIVDFGVFMKFPVSAKTASEKGPELEGLVHISELDWQLIENPADIVKLGQKVKAKIIDISGDKVSLSLKALKEDPWKDIEKKYKKGDVVKCRVTKFNPFGAFVQLEPQIQGLCHISEFGIKTKMEEALKIGKKYDFQIVSIEPAEHRISLKLAEKE